MSYNPNQINRIVLIGVNGEHDSQHIEFDMTKWLEEFPSASITIILQRPTETIPYAVNSSLNYETKTLTWLVSNVDTAIVGNGYATIIARENSVIKKSYVFDIEIVETIGATGEIPEALENWYNRMIEAELNTQAYSVLSKSYAVGGTSSRTGEDTDNAKYYKEQAEQKAIECVEAKEQTEAYSEQASESATEAYTSKTQAEQAKVEAVEAKEETEQIKSEVETLKQDTEDLKEATEEYKNEAKTYAEDIENMTVDAETAEAGTPASVEKTKPDNYHLHFIIPKGDKGDKGDTGESGSVNFATFDINYQTGQLEMTYDSELSGNEFSINEKGELLFNANN